MDVFEFFCQFCGQRLEASKADIGRVAECPSCAGHVRIPAPASATVAPVKLVGAGEEFEFQCPACQQALSARQQDIGQDVSCPACDNIFAIPDPNARAEAASPRKTPPRLASNRAAGARGKSLSGGARGKTAAGNRRDRDRDKDRERERNRRHPTSGRQRAVGGRTLSGQERRNRKTASGSTPGSGTVGTGSKGKERPGSVGTGSKGKDRSGKRPINPKTGGRGFILLDEDTSVVSDIVVAQDTPPNAARALSRPGTPRRAASSPSRPSAPEPAHDDDEMVAALPAALSDAGSPADPYDDDGDLDDPGDYDSTPQGEMTDEALVPIPEAEDDEDSDSSDAAPLEATPVSDDEMAAWSQSSAGTSDDEMEVERQAESEAVDALFAGVDAQFGFDDADRALEDIVGRVAAASSHSAQNLHRRLSEGSVAVIPTVSDAFGTAREEMFTDHQAERIALKAVRVALEDMEATNDCSVLLEPPEDTRVPDAPMPQFFGYIRPSPTDVKGAWVLVFFQAHVLAYEVGTRKLTTCRSPEFEMDVRYKPGIEGVNKTHLGFVLKTKDRQVCLIKLAFNPNGQLSNAARDFSLQVKNWLKQHPVLGRRIESRLKQVASVREQMRAKGRRG